jgi:hypothetical protein
MSIFSIALSSSPPNFACVTQNSILHARRPAGKFGIIHLLVGRLSAIGYSLDGRPSASLTAFGGLLDGRARRLDNDF